MGGTDLSGFRVIKYIGTDRNSPGNGKELGIIDIVDADNTVVIFSRNASVNFRSRDESGLHFIANFTYGYQCPSPCM
jgi:hypothetical protein